MALDPNRWTLKTTEAVNAAIDSARTNANPELTPDHLLAALVRQPEGVVNYMITIGADGVLVKVSQVLTEENFAQVQPGMAMEQVRRLLGKPRKVQTFPLNGETSQDWRFQPKGQTEPMIFSVAYDRDLRVIRTGTMPDPDLQRR